MPRALIVTSMFLPYLAADVHRARILARELPEIGWDVELLVPGDAFQRADYLEPNAEQLRVPAPVHRAQPEWDGLFRLLRSRSLSWRAYRPMQRLGDFLLAQRRFDLVYFSCSQANFPHLGLHWKRRFQVPFIVDLHDPWYTPGLHRPKHLSHWKRRLGNAIACRLERATLKEAAGLVSVSAEYLATLNHRYAGEAWPSLRAEHQATLPFGASAEDLRAAAELPDPEHVSAGGDFCTVVYTGAGGHIMEKSFRELCGLLAKVRKESPELLTGLRVQLFGTEPEAVGRLPVLSRVAAEAGLSDLVSEFPARIGYLEALRRVQGAAGLLVLGVDDPAYSPSKLFLYGLSGKPILACMRDQSTVDGYFEQCPALGRLVHFSPERQETNAKNLVMAFLQDAQGRQSIDRRGLLSEYLAPTMSRRHVELFRACLGPGLLPRGEAGR